MPKKLKENFEIHEALHDIASASSFAVGALARIAFENNPEAQQIFVKACQNVEPPEGSAIAYQQFLDAVIKHLD